MYILYYATDRPPTHLHEGMVYPSEHLLILLHLLRHLRHGRIAAAAAAPEVGQAERGNYIAGPLFFPGIQTVVLLREENKNASITTSINNKHQALHRPKQTSCTRRIITNTRERVMPAPRPSVHRNRQTKFARR